MKQELDFKKISILIFAVALFFVSCLAVFFIAKSAMDVKKTEGGPAARMKSVSDRSASGDEGGFSFAILGDTQRFDPDNQKGGFQGAVGNIRKTDVSFVMAVGDLLSSCDGGSKCEKKYADWKRVLGDLYGKTYEVMGNHDRTGKEDADELWRETFDLPQNGPEGYSELAYSFDFENSHFVVLNSEMPEEHVVDGAQRDWLEKDLLVTDKENIFVFFHEPAYPVSSKIGSSLDDEEIERDALWKIFKEKKVAAVFNGHEHIYSRKNIEGVYQFVVGNSDAYDHDMPKKGAADFAYQGKSFAIVDVVGKRATVSLYSSDGKLVDEFGFSE